MENDSMEIPCLNVIATQAHCYISSTYEYQKKRPAHMEKRPICMENKSMEVPCLNGFVTQVHSCISKKYFYMKKRPAHMEKRRTCLENNYMEATCLNVFATQVHRCTLNIYEYMKKKTAYVEKSPAYIVKRDIHLYGTHTVKRYLKRKIDPKKFPRKHFVWRCHRLAGHTNTFLHISYIYT